jgi:hypothetical protein
MRPWSADQPPRAGDVRPRRMSGTPAPEQEPSFSGHAAPGSMNWGADQPAGTWSGGLPPFNNQAAPPRMPPPPGMTKTVSRPMSGGDAAPPAPKRDVMQPAPSLGQFGRATGLSLKLRFLLALTLLSLAPAFLLVLLYQQANQASLDQAGQQTLTAVAQANSNTLTQELTSRQAYLARLAQQSIITQVTSGSPSAATIQQAEDLLNTASLATSDAGAWLVLNGSDQIVAASPASAAGQSLGSTTLLAHPGALENFVQAERKAPAPKSGQTTLAVASGQDVAFPNKVWIATLDLLTPSSPSQSGVVLAVFSLPTLVSTYFSALPSDSSSYAGLFDTQGTILGAAGNQNLNQQSGQALAIAPLQDLLQALKTGQSSAEQVYHDPTTDKDEVAAGFMNKTLGMVFVVVAPPGDLTPPTTGLLEARNLPLIFLTIFVVTTLVATWVALPIVRPIRQATRDILASTNDVRLLAEQAKQIAKDQRLGTDILESAAKGLDMRRRAIGRDASLIANSSSAAATRLAQLAHAINELPEQFQGPMQALSREIYQELQTAHQLASGISSSLESDPAQKRLGNVMEGAAEISQQFDQASQQLEHGASRLEHAADSLQ